MIDSKTPDFVLMESVCLWSWTVGRLVDVSARSLPAATACSFVVTLSAALRVPAMLSAAFVGFVCGSAQLGLCHSWLVFSPLLCWILTGRCFAQV